MGDTQEVGKLELSGSPGDDQDDCHSVLSDLVEHSWQEWKRREGIVDLV